MKYFLSRLNDGIKDIEHVRTLFRGWKRSLTLKATAARQTGAGAQEPTTESEEMMYELIQKNKSLRALTKVVFERIMGK